MKELNQAIELVLIYLQGIWLRRRYIILTAWLVCPLGWLFVFNLPPTYQADAKLYVETRSVLDPILSGLTYQTNPQQEVELMARTLLSRPNLEKIARATDMDVSATNSEAYEKLVDGLKTDIKLSSSGRENIYVISYANASSALALKVVQETLNTFVEGQVGNAAADNKKAAEFLDQQIADYEKRLVDAESRLSNFKKEQQLIGPASDVGFYTRIESENNSLDEIRLTLAQLQSQLESARRQLKGELSSTDQNHGGIATQYDERIKLLDSQLDSLLIRYTDQHPDVVETRRLLDNLKTMRNSELQQLSQQLATGGNSSAVSQNTVYQELRLSVAKLENEIEATLVRERSVKQKLEVLQSQRNIIPDIEAKLAGLNRDYEITKVKYEELLSRRESINLSQQAEESTQDVQFKVIEPPRVPINPSGPKRILLYTAILIFGFIAGIAMAFIRSQLQPVVTSALQLKTITDYPVFGLISHTQKATLVKHNRKHLFYFILLTGALVVGYSAFVVNEMVFGITMIQIWGWIA
jgi:polysaccharide chain length determinant protein (PEP-CTERM system associated)